MPATFSSELGGEGTYRDGNEWKSPQSFRASDLPMISFASQEAYHRLMEEKQMS